MTVDDTHVATACPRCHLLFLPGDTIAIVSRGHGPSAAIFHIRCFPPAELSRWVTLLLDHGLAVTLKRTFQPITKEVSP